MDNIFIDENGKYDEKKAFTARVEYLNSNHADEIAELKSKYTFHIIFSPQLNSRTLRDMGRHICAIQIM